MEFRVLGRLQVVEDGRPLPLGGRRQRLVLASLLLHAGEVVTTDRLIDAVWGDEPPATARKSLQAYVSRLRKQLGEATIEAVASGYVIHVAPDQLDAARFEELAMRGHGMVIADAKGAAAMLSDALSLWHGNPWGDLADEPELRSDVERLRELRLATVEDRLEADLELGRAGLVVGELEALVADHPLRERPRRLLMLALYQTGRQTEALAVYRETRRQLGEELGIEPSPELQRLEEQILLHDPGLRHDETSPGSTRSAVRNPYKGLRPFGERDAADFFGRESVTQELVDRITKEQFVAVVGPSGSGKSSIVRAGLVPALRAGAAAGSDTWVIATMLPGAHPFEEMEAALVRAAPQPLASLADQVRGDDLDLLRCVLRVRPDEATPTLLIIDQFEELFVLVDELQRNRFLRNLFEAVGDPHGTFHVIVTLRADFFHRALEHPDLGRWVTSGQINVLPIGGSELEAAVVRPAAGVGVGVEPELVAELVADVAGEPGALPLCQFVLTELFEQRPTDTLTLAAYRGLGGLRGALSRRADGLYAALDTDERQATRQIFLRLVTLGEGTTDTRRRVPRSELEQLASTRSTTTVLDRFGQARLLTFDLNTVTFEPTVEVAHEALLTEWHRLRSWIDESRSDLRLHQSLAREAEQWQTAGRDPDYLLTGSRLTVFGDWYRTTTLALAETEAEYIAASRLRRDEEAAAERRRQDRERLLERRSLTRLRVLVTVLAVAAVLGAGLTAFALSRSREASAQADRAEAEAAAARAARDEQVLAAQKIRIKELTAASIANHEVDPELGLLLALHAVDLSDLIGEPVPANTVAALHWALQAARIQYPNNGAPAVLAGPDGHQGIFQLDLPDLLTVARANVSRSLTPAECTAYFDPDTCPTLSTVFSPSLVANPSEPLNPDAAKPLAGTRVAMLGPFVGSEAAALRSELEQFGEDSGIDISYVGSPDSETILYDRFRAGNPPDLALLPQPGVVAAFARGGALMDLSRYLDVARLGEDQSIHLLSLGTVAADGTWPATDGGLYGVPFQVSIKSLIWYPVPEFHDAGYQIPTTWSQLVALTEQMVADGRTPWCHGEGSRDASGWPGTDWIEDLVLHEAGPAAYDAWVRHEIGFDSAAVRRAFDKFGALLLAEGHVKDGQQAAAAIQWIIAAHPMFDDPPGCWLFHQGSFASAYFPYGVFPGVDVATFPFPAIAPEHAAAVLGGGNFIVAFTDRPEVREAVRHLTSPDFGIEMAKLNSGFISPNQRFPLDEYQICDSADPATRTCYPNEHTQSMAELVPAALAADAFRFDASDLMPPEIGTGVFWKAMVEFVGEGPENLDSILTRIDLAWEELSQSGP